MTFDGNDTLSLPAGRDPDGTANLTCLDYSDFPGETAVLLRKWFGSFKRLSNVSPFYSYVVRGKVLQNSYDLSRALITDMSQLILGIVER